MSEPSENLDKLRQLTKTLPAFTATQCLELGMYEEVDRLVELDMFSDKDISVRRAFLPDGQKMEDYSHDGALELCMVFHGRVTFTFETRTVRCTKGGVLVILPGEVLTAEAHGKCWMLFARIT